MFAERTQTSGSRQEADFRFRPVADISLTAQSTRMPTQTCSKCGATHPLDREHFGQFSNRGVVGWRRVCRACMRTNAAAHAAANPEQRAERSERRLQRERASCGAIQAIDVPGLRRKLDDKCRYCGEALRSGGELDHLTPVSRGGSGQAGNITLACMPCNRNKHSKTLPEYLNWRKARRLPVRDIAVDGEFPDVPLTEAQRRSY